MNLQILIARLGFIYPILLSICLIYWKHGLLLKGDIIENILTTFVIVATCNIFGKNRWSLIAEIIILVGFSVFMFIEIAHLYLYEHFFSASTIFVLLETSPSESREFLTNYIDGALLFSGISILLVMTFSIRRLIANFRNGGPFLFDFRIPLPFIRWSIPFQIVYFLGSLACLFFMKLAPHHKHYIVAHTFVDGYQQYQEHHVAYQKLGQDKLGGDFSDVQHQGIDEELYIFVIGESTTRNHMNLYGYERNTTPRLNEIKEELSIYKDVISPHTNTIPTLSKVLTLANYEAPNRKFDGSVIQLFNQANFKTFWLSTQQPIGLHETFVTGISNSCDQQVFLSSYNELPYDEAVLMPLSKILQDTTAKKVIFVHLMGTHIDYQNRYPTTFNRFQDKPNTKFEHSTAYHRINAYDNAVLYNDFVVREIIEQARKTTQKASVLYFSDHGEEVYSKIDFAGHGGGILSPAMYEIPFILWQSPHHKRNTSFVINTNRKFMIDDFLFSAADLANIQFKELEVERSLFHTKYKERKRIIHNRKTYEEQFNLQRPVQ